MTYQANIPQAAQFISSSQPDLLDNFTVLKSSFDANHEAFNTANVGKHKFVQLTRQAAAPATPGNDLALYSLLASSAVSELFYRPQTNGVAQQVTNVPITTGVNAGTAGGTVIFFDTIFGIRIYSGLTASIPGSASKTVIFTTPYSTLLTGQCTVDDPNAIAVSSQVSTTGMTIRVANTTLVNWFAIGRI